MATVLCLAALCWLMGPAVQGAFLQSRSSVEYPDTWSTAVVPKTGIYIISARVDGNYTTLGESYLKVKVNGKELFVVFAVGTTCSGAMALKMRRGSIVTVELLGTTPPPPHTHTHSPPPPHPTQPPPPAPLFSKKQADCLFYSQIPALRLFKTGYGVSAVQLHLQCCLPGRLAAIQVDASTNPRMHVYHPKRWFILGHGPILSKWDQPARGRSLRKAVLR